MKPRACALLVVWAVPALNVAIWIALAIQPPPPAPVVAWPRPWALLALLKPPNAPSTEPSASAAAPSAVATLPSAAPSAAPRPGVRRAPPARVSPLKPGIHGEIVDPWGTR